MTNCSDVSIERDHGYALMEKQRREQNEQVRNETDCKICGDEVPTEDYSWKFMAAGGVLDGPFCSSECMWENLS